MDAGEHRAVFECKRPRTAKTVDKSRQILLLFWCLSLLPTSQICHIFETLIRLEAAQTPTGGSKLHNKQSRTAVSAPVRRASNCCVTEVRQLGEFTLSAYHRSPKHDMISLVSCFYFPVITVKQDDTTWPGHRTNGKCAGSLFVAPDSLLQGCENLHIHS